MESDRERAAVVLAEYRHLRNSNLAGSVLDAMLEFAAQEAERLRRILYEAELPGGLIMQQRAAELRAQKEAV